MSKPIEAHLYKHHFFGEKVSGLIATNSLTNDKFMVYRQILKEECPFWVVPVTFFFEPIRVGNNYVPRYTRICDCKVDGLE